MADIQCPSCGTMNAAGQEFCRTCQSPLQAADAYEVGQAPTKKVTAELEPILPQWLRDARSQARKSAEEEAEQAANLALTGKDDEVDLLAGLQAQAREDDDEVPDWLGNITGQPGTGKKPKAEESSDVRWVELGGGTGELPSIPAAQSPVFSSDENELPSWISNITGQSDDPRQDTLTGWLKGGIDLPAPESEAPPVTPPIDEAAPPMDPFSFFDPRADAVSETKSKTKPSFEQSPAIKRPEGYAPLEAGLPDWLKTPEGGPGPERPPDTGELPEWLSRLDTAPLPSLSDPPELPQAAPSDLISGMGTAADSAAEPTFASGLESPDWLRNLETGTSADSLAPVAPELPADDSAFAPSWLDNLGAPRAEAGLSTKDLSEGPAHEPAGEAAFDSPDWLQNLGTESAPETSTFAEDLKATPTGMTDDLLGGSPDWLKNLGSIEPPDAQPASAFAQPDEPAPVSAASAFTGDIGSNIFSSESLSAGDLDSLFVEMPDWLAATGAVPASTPPAAENINVITPGSLPSWVEAMRPVESSAPASAATDRTLEGRGPLAGLQGVLPAVAFFAPSSKPRAYSLKLTASEEQQAHAALLDEVLAVETVPAPIVSPRVLVSQRLLRLAVAALLFLVLIPTALGGTQIFPLPVSTNVAPQVQRGLESIWALPANAPVLVVFDYDPARAAEMDALAVPLLDQMLLLGHPRLTMISTSPAGATLAERLFSGPLAGHNYQRGAQYINLGFLPGGLSGVRAFAQNPAAVSPFAIDGSQAWSSPVLQDVQTFGNFAAVIVLTDSAETGRVWIEQAGPLRGASPMVIAASAQTGPLLQPYFQSAQINGLFKGLQDAAVIEQINAGRPGTTRRYWDAYNLGLLLAVAVIAGGSLFGLLPGLRERAEAKSA